MTTTGVRNVSGDFDTSGSLNTVKYYLYSEGKPIASYLTYEETSAHEGKLILQRLDLKPAKGGIYKHYNAHRKLNNGGV